MTGAEVLTAMREGKKVRRKGWKDGAYIKLSFDDFREDITPYSWKIWTDFSDEFVEEHKVNKLRRCELRDEQSDYVAGILATFLSEFFTDDWEII